MSKDEIRDGLTLDELLSIKSPSAVYPGGKPARDARLAELRALHQGDDLARQQLDSRIEGGEYRMKIMDFVKATEAGDKEKLTELRAWFYQYYPDIQE